MLWWRVRKFITCAAAVAVFAAACLAVRAVNVSRLSNLQGDRTFYLDSPSSQSLCVKNLSLADFSRVKGESITFTLETRAADPDKLAEELAKTYGAQVLVKEQTGGVISYYCYTDKWTDGVCVAGNTVNLHIAIECERVGVGSPIIFGGF